jgi:hypothetical protein
MYQRREFLTSAVHGAYILGRDGSQKIYSGVIRFSWQKTVAF